jgi:hypothetical protein
VPDTTVYSFPVYEQNANVDRYNKFYINFSAQTSNYFIDTGNTTYVKTTWINPGEYIYNILTGTTSLESGIILITGATTSPIKKTYPNTSNRIYYEGNK